MDILTTWLSFSSKTHSESVWTLYLGSHAWQGISSWPFVALSLFLIKKPRVSCLRGSLFYRLPKDNLNASWLQRVPPERLYIHRSKSHSFMMLTVNLGISKESSKISSLSDGKTLDLPTYLPYIPLQNPSMFFQDYNWESGGGRKKDKKHVEPSERLWHAPGLHS